RNSERSWRWSGPLLWWPWQRSHRGCGRSALARAPSADAAVSPVRSCWSRASFIGYPYWLPVLATPIWLTSFSGVAGAWRYRSSARQVQQVFSPGDCLGKAALEDAGPERNRAREHCQGAHRLDGEADKNDRQLWRCLADKTKSEVHHQRDCHYRNRDLQA